MLFKKTGMPEEGEIVLCIVTKIHFNSVFANLTEYDRSGMIHISEISPGRIRNIRDFVEEGKVIICRVLRIDKERGHIDLSLRRVNEAQKRAKNNQIKQEQLAEKIIELAAKELKKDTKTVYYEVAPKILKKYELVYSFFEAVINQQDTLENANITGELGKTLQMLIEQRIKPPIVEITANLKLISYEPAGIEDIKKALVDGQKAGGEQAKIFYLGSGQFQLRITTETYKEAEDVLKKVVTTTQKKIESLDGTFEYERTDQK